ncbi:MAG: peroxiredoxin family protein [Isosphaeraceae bacterium]
MRSLLSIARPAAILAMSWCIATPILAEEPPRVGAAAPDFALESVAGGQIKLSEAVARGPVVLVVLRGYPGYQCPICSAQVGELRGKFAAGRGEEPRVILVYPGPSKELKARAQEFLGGKALPENFDLVLDPDYTFTKAYGLRWDAPNETAYPSTFVIDREGKVRFAKISRAHGGRAKAAEIAEALGQAR